MEEFWSAKGRAAWKECFSKGFTEVLLHERDVHPLVPALG